MLDFARHADRAIYVLIAVMAMTVALEGVETRPGRALGAVIATAVALTLAELFADRVGISIRKGRQATEAERQEEHREALTGLAVVAIPISFFVLAQWAGFGILAIYSYVASRASGGSRMRSIVGAVGLTAIGGALILLNSATK